MSVRPGFLFLLAASALWAGASAVSPRAQAEAENAPELIYFPSGRMVERAALGYPNAAAAAAWLRTVQYYGEHARGDHSFDMLFHLCDVVTDLDPRFEEPYIFGSFVLLTDGHKPEEGRKLLEKGLAENPGSWRILFETGFVNYIVWRDYAAGAAYFRKAAAIPGAPEYVARFAAYVSARAGETEASLLIWKELAQRTDNPEMRAKALEKVKELEEELRKGAAAPGDSPASPAPPSRRIGVGS